MPPRRRKLTIRQSLSDLGLVDPSVFHDGDTNENCSNRDEEFKILKKSYFRQVLKCHPDKGGDPDVFRQVQTSFELLRNLHNGGKGGNWLFVDCMQSTAEAVDANADGSSSTDNTSGNNDEEYDMADYDADFSNMQTPSWEYYEQAAEEPIPPYRMELAKSNRSKCKQTGLTAKRCFDQPLVDAPEASDGALVSTADEFIQKGEVRIGFFNSMAGTYGNWVHLRCWRVPHKIWLGLPDPNECEDPLQFERALAGMNLLHLCGFSEIPHVEQRKVIQYVMQKSNWARARSVKKSAAASKAEASNQETNKPDIATSNGPETQGTKSSTAVGSKSPKADIVSSGRKRFVVPVPGKNGAQPNVFAGKTFVLTGTFPELGGGAGLSLGKAKAKAMITSFGGRVTGSVSGKTDVLVVGKTPGMSKVSQARSKEKVKLVSLMDLKDGLDSSCACLEDFSVSSNDEPMKIRDFSSGYSGNGLALTASKKALAVAQGLIQKKKRPIAAIENTEDGTGDDTKKPVVKKHQPLMETSSQTKKQPIGKKKKSTVSTTKPKTSTEPSTALVVATTNRRSSRKRSAPTSYY